MELTILAVTIAVIAVAFAAALASRGLMVSEDSLWTSTTYFLAAGTLLVLTFFAVSFVIAADGLSAISAAQ